MAKHPFSDKQLPIKEWWLYSNQQLRFGCLWASQNTCCNKLRRIGEHQNTQERSINNALRDGRDDVRGCLKKCQIWPPGSHKSELLVTVRGGEPDSVTVETTQESC